MQRRQTATSTKKKNKMNEYSIKLKLTPKQLEELSNKLHDICANEYYETGSVEETPLDLLYKLIAKEVK